MKKVVANKELQIKMNEAIKLLCETVKTTLGPKGRNVIIDHSTFSPFITNDGVTIAENIESEDPVINTILELAKEASIKTNENVGDGTTTTLVLLESIYEEGQKIIENGYSPIILKKEIDEEVIKIIEDIKKTSKKPNDLELECIASIAANDLTIGRTICNAYKKVGANSIKINEHNNEETIINYLKGYYFDTIIASPYFFKNEEIISLNNSKVLILNKELTYIEEISDIINYLFKNNESMVIIAKEYSEEFKNEIISMYYENNLKMILLKSPSYGDEELNILSDISIIVNSNIVYKIEDIDIRNLGTVENIEIKKDITKLSFKSNKKTEERIKELEIKKANTTEYKKSNIEKRIAMFKYGTAEILVGAPTTTERREKKMRYDDALCALKSASKGVVPGSGIVLYKISNKLKSESAGIKILKETLTKPIIQIYENATLNYEFILKEIKNNNYEVLYNIKTDEYESILNTKVIDTTDVVINALKNASSIAGMLLTTTSLIINEYKNDFNKVNDYNEL